MRRIFFVLTLFSMFLCLTGCTTITPANLPGLVNPWKDCGRDFDCALEKAGFDFPRAEYSVRAMKGMIEIEYLLDDSRKMIIRKSPDDINNGDISGDNTKYPVNKTVSVNNELEVNVRGTEKSYNVAYFATESGYYSLMCDRGFSHNELETFVLILLELERNRLS